MKILFVGADGKGSFQMRGKQLGEAVGGRVTNKPTADDWTWADVIVLVKRAAMLHGQAAKHTGKPLIWDVVDAWKQPDENQVPVEHLRDQFRKIADVLKVKTIIGATEAMAKDLGGVCVPHHCRVGLTPEPIRESHELVVAYEGQPKYLGKWRENLEAACARLGFAFVVNPPDLRMADAIVAFRGGRWDGDVCRQWKSGVKYANAVVAGRPVLTQETSAFAEIRPVGMAMELEEDLVPALSGVMSAKTRLVAYESALARKDEFSLETIAGKYRAIIHSTARAAA